MAFLVPDKVYEINGVTVKDYFLTEHNRYGIALPGKRTKQLLGVTIHNTEAIVQAKGTTMAEQYTRATLNGNMSDVHVHYYVDDVEAWHNLPDNWIGWHAADGAGDGNTATIAIEVIGKSSKAEENAAKLAAGILKMQGLSADCLYTHSHWMNKKIGRKGSREYLNTLHNPRKNCPIYILPHWEKFEKNVAQYYLDCVNVPEIIPDLKTPEAVAPNALKIGCIVNFKGGYHYASSTAKSPTGGKRTAGTAKITAIANGAAHPYHLIGEKGGSNVYGWVDEELVKAVEETKETLSLGDRVRVKKGARTYKGGALASFVYNCVYVVMQIGSGVAPDYIVIGTGNQITAAVKAEDLERV